MATTVKSVMLVGLIVCFSCVHPLANQCVAWGKISPPKVPKPKIPNPVEDLEKKRKEAEKRARKEAERAAAAGKKIGDQTGKVLVQPVPTPQELQRRADEARRAQLEEARKRAATEFNRRQQEAHEQAQKQAQQAQQLSEAIANRVKEHVEKKKAKLQQAVVANKQVTPAAIGDNIVQEGKRVRDKIQNKILDGEQWGGERAYFAYRNAVMAMNSNTEPIKLTAQGRHYQRLVNSVAADGKPILLVDADTLASVSWHFSASMPKDFSAVTFGKRIYVGAKYDPTDPNLTQTMAHELVHVAQYDRLGGEKEFGRRYFGQIADRTRAAYHGAQVAGGGAVSEAWVLKYLTFDIHNDLGLEQEAIDRENAWSKWWDDQGQFNDASITATSWH